MIPANRYGLGISRIFTQRPTSGKFSAAGSHWR
jgi:hypothetical protein